ncbi:MAG: glycosyltransferase family 87 protein [Planctomycetota bacterium]|nr:glycosyltransferase family 87 protein [Planctomycetota bacterium]MEC8559465.1 glycosyltransferase family 87 protein [Planctomycetota bacterium]
MPPTLTRPVDVRNAWLIWLGFAIGVVLFAWSEGFSHTVTSAYRGGAEPWLAHQPIYTVSQWGGFLYPPVSAMLFAPFTLLPHDLGEALWRLTNLGVLAWGVRQASAAASRLGGVELFPLSTLLCLAALLPAARNGQATLLITGLLLVAVEATVRRRWWTAGAMLALATVIKPIAVVLLLLYAALRPRVVVPVVVALLVLCSLPALHDGVAKATTDLGQWVEKLRSVSLPPESLRVSDVFGGLTAFGIRVPPGIAYGIRAAAALLTLGLCFVAFRRFGHAPGVLLTGALGLSYMLLFNARTENNTYGALAPAQAILASWLILAQSRMLLGVVVASLPFIGLSGYELGKFITPGRETWIAPLSGTVFLVVLCLVVFMARPIRTRGTSGAATGSGASSAPG